MTINKCRLPVFRTSMINDSRMQMKNSAFFQVSCRTVKLNLTQQQWRGFKNSQIHFGILCFEKVTNNHRWFFFIFLPEIFFCTNTRHHRKTATALRVNWNHNSPLYTWQKSNWFTCPPLWWSHCECRINLMLTLFVYRLVSNERKKMDGRAILKITLGPLPDKLMSKVKL